MNQFGPTTASLESAMDRAINSWQAAHPTHIDTVLDLQAHGFAIEDIVNAEPPNLLENPQ